MTCSVIKQISKSPCVLGHSFNCSSTSMQVAHGCRALFACSGVHVQCGQGGKPRRLVHTCACSDCSNTGGCGDDVHSDPTLPPDQPLLYVHVPKAGTSFAKSVKIWGGHEYPAHHPIDEHVDMTNLSRMTMVFRQPEERLLSMYWFLKLRQMLCCFSNYFGWEGGSREHFRVVRAINRGEPPQEVLGSFTGCQLNMLMGHRCCSRHKYKAPMHEVIAHAKERIDRLFFVGLQSQWKLSICLFNYRMTGVRYVTKFQMHNCRATDATFSIRKNESRRHKFDVGDLKPDPLDQAVFNLASARFWREIIEHNISEANCVLASMPDIRYFRSEANDTCSVVDEARVLRMHRLAHLSIEK